LDIYERYGRKTEQLEQVMETNITLVTLLQALKDGTANIEDIVIGPTSMGNGGEPIPFPVLEGGQ